MIKFVLLVNKQGQTRLSQYYGYTPVEERVTTEADIVRKCLSRNEEAVSELLISILLMTRLASYILPVLFHGIQELQSGLP